MWLCFGIYRPPTPGNLASFFEELTGSLSKRSEFYENVIVLGDFYVDVKVAGRELDKNEEFCDLFNLTKLIRNETCFTRDHKSAIDLIVTNEPKSFQNTCITETGLSDFRTLMLTFFKTQVTHLKPKIISYRNYKHFEDTRFLEDLNSIDVSLNTDEPNKNYSSITDKFPNVVNRHAPLKKKTLRGNQAPFLTKELRKEIHIRSKLMNKYNKNPTENKTICKKQRNTSVSLRRKAIKVYFNNVTKTGVQTNKDFRKLFTLFLRNKGFLENTEIILTEKDKIVTGEKELVRIFNDRYINIVELLPNYTSQRCKRTGN